jgi:hypothetical protein
VAFSPPTTPTLAASESCGSADRPLDTDQRERINAKQSRISVARFWNHEKKRTGFRARSDLCGGEGTEITPALRDGAEGNGS